MRHAKRKIIFFYRCAWVKPWYLHLFYKAVVVITGAFQHHVADARIFIARRHPAAFVRKRGPFADVFRRARHMRGQQLKRKHQRQYKRQQLCISSCAFHFLLLLL